MDREGVSEQGQGLCRRWWLGWVIVRTYGVVRREATQWACSRISETGGDMSVGRELVGIEEQRCKDLANSATRSSRTRPSRCYLGPG